MASNSLHDKAPNSLPTATYSSRLVQPKPLQLQQQPQQSSTTTSTITLNSSHFNLAPTLFTKSTSTITHNHSIAINSLNGHHDHHLFSTFVNHHHSTHERSGTADARFHRTDMLDSNNLQTTNNIVPSFRNNTNVSIALASQHQQQQQQHQQQQQQQSQQQSLFAIGSQSSVANPGVAAAAAVASNSTGCSANANNNNGLSGNTNVSSNGSLPSTLDLSEFPSLSGSLSGVGIPGNNSLINTNQLNNSSNTNHLNPIGTNGSGHLNSGSIGSNSSSNSREAIRSTADNNQSLLGNNLIGGLGNVGAGRPYVGIIKDGSTVTTSVTSRTAEFNIHSEDFPALSGSSDPSSVSHEHTNNQIGSSIGGLFGSSSSVNALPSSCSSGNSNSLLNNTNGLSSQNSPDSGVSSDSKASSTSSGSQSTLNPNGSSTASATSSSTTTGGVKSLQAVGTPGQTKRGIQTSKDGRVSNIPSGMVTDQFGMVGLLTFIRAAESDPSLVNLALGTDLTTLKLDLNRVGCLYSTFPGPWSEIPLKPHEIDFPVPQEYLINNQIRDKLAPIKLARYGDDTLFFLFYMFPNEVIQAAAANEL